MTRDRFSIITDGLPNQLPDIDREETREWLESLGSARELLRADGSDPESNKAVLHHLASRPLFEQFLEQRRREEPRQGAA